MELKDFIQAGLDRIKQATARAVDGLSYSELMRQPGPEANSIGLILFHMARSEDRFMQARVQGKPETWESEKWYQKLNLPLSETGSAYTAEQVSAFVAPELKDIMTYADAVRVRTLDYLKNMTPDEFERVINLPRQGDITVGAVFALALVHLAQHAGEVSYLRGLQRGMNK